VSSNRSFLTLLKTAWRKPVFHYGASFSLSAFFLFLAFRGTDFAKILEAIQRANYFWLLIGFSVMMLSHVVRAWRWRYLLDPVKPGIPLRNLFSGVMIGYFVNNILPRAGELARPYAIRRTESVPASAALGTVVVERILDTLMFLSLVFAIPVVYDGPLLESFPWLPRAGTVLMLVMVPMMALPLVLMVRRDWTDRIVHIIAQRLPRRFGGRLKWFTHSFLDGFLFLTKPASAIVTLSTTAVIWGLYMLSMYFSFFGFGLQETLGFDAAFVTLAISSIGIAIPTPGGTGTYHAFVSQTLTQLFAVNSAVALSYATATHAIMFIGVSVIGLYFLMKDQMSLAEAVKAGAKEGG
jgi:hypothetical protein